MQRSCQGWAWEFGAATKLRVRPHSGGAPRSLGLLERIRGARKVFESLPAGSEALLWECFPSAVTIPISVLQTLCPGGSGRCEVLSLGGVWANSCKILCTKNSSTSGQFKAAWSVRGPDLELEFKSLKINLLSAPSSFSARCLMRPTRLGSAGT